MMSSVFSLFSLKVLYKLNFEFLDFYYLHDRIFWSGFQLGVSIRQESCTYIYVKYNRSLIEFLVVFFSNWDFFSCSRDSRLQAIIYSRQHCFSWSVTLSKTSKNLIIHK